MRFARRGPSVLRKDLGGKPWGPPAVTGEAGAIRLLAAGAWAEILGCCRLLAESSTDICPEMAGR